jgi:hypothetical protein
VGSLHLFPTYECSKVNYPNSGTRVMKAKMNWQKYEALCAKVCKSAQLKIVSNHNYYLNQSSRKKYLKKIS